MRRQGFSTEGARPAGRAMGRSLDPLDQRSGYPWNGVEAVGPYALDDDGRPLDRTMATTEATSLQTAARRMRIEAARRQAQADAAAKARAGERTPVSVQNAPAATTTSGGGGGGGLAVWIDNTNRGIADAATPVDKIKAAAPYIGIGLLLIVAGVVVWRARKGA